MVMAMGVGAYSRAIPPDDSRLLFKAMLFLTWLFCNSRMEVRHDPSLAQDMRMMGGLHMPITAITFLIVHDFWNSASLLASGRKMKFWQMHLRLTQLLGCGLSNCWNYGFICRMYFSTFEGNFAAMKPNRHKLKSEVEWR